MSRKYLFNHSNALSTCRYFLILSKLCSSCVCDCLHLEHDRPPSSGNSRPISEGTQNPQLNTRRNTAKIVVGLILVFLISYVPYHAFWNYFICTIERNILFLEKYQFFLYSNYKFQYTDLTSSYFLLIISCLNPVALFCTGSPFRQHSKRFLIPFCKTNSPSSDLEL